MSKNRKRLASISSPGGKTVKWIKNPEAVVRRSSVKEVLKNFAKFTGKHLYWRLFKKELQVSRLYHNLLEKVPHISKANFAILFSSENIPPLEVFHKKAVLKNCTKFAEKNVLGYLFRSTLLKIFCAKETRSLHITIVFSSLDIMNYLYIK